MVVVEGVAKTYRTGRVEVRALRGVSFELPAGELVTLRGRSGAGKTTLLNLLGGLERADAGTVRVAGREVTSLGEGGLAELRRDVIGYVFQSHGLLPVLSAAENVEVPLRLARAAPAERAERVRTLLALVGLSDHAGQRPHELSGGQRQRVAIARALANRPRLVLADEPTGQLDSETAAAIMPLLRAVARSEGVTVLTATHDQVLLGLSDRVLTLHDGLLTTSAPSPAG
ncbi:ABC transporter ATP-binding protein [Actinomadura sp. PM05-2]|uniref:ABC transporter ATP-binding protein n=1 Tax=Actinomadura parmotrematis TaxID=2864039 RepID=A0ABS7FTJ9_9ACTN|nr:ABC transporter ATP-binding protein [Actinomadura parmotrematis]